MDGSIAAPNAPVLGADSEKPEQGYKEWKHGPNGWTAQLDQREVSIPKATAGRPAGLSDPWQVLALRSGSSSTRQERNGDHVIIMLHIIYIYIYMCVCCFYGFSFWGLL